MFTNIRVAIALSIPIHIDLSNMDISKHQTILSKYTHIRVLFYNWIETVLPSFFNPVFRNLIFLNIKCNFTDLKIVYILMTKKTIPIVDKVCVNCDVQITCFQEKETNIPRVYLMTLDYFIASFPFADLAFIFNYVNVWTLASKILACWSSHQKYANISTLWSRFIIDVVY